MFHIEGLHFSYGSQPVLNGISTDIGAGEFLALVGPNGAGKSTFLKILAGLLRRFDGTVEFSGRPLRDYDTRDLARRVAFVPQETHVVFPFTADEIVLMGRLPHRAGFAFDSRHDLDCAREAMTRTDTATLSGKTFNELSGGEKQRVVLASALAQEPEVLLLDEPTVYLDLKHQIQFYDILERLNTERKITVISVTHDINLAARYARRMIGIDGGTFKADGRPDELMRPALIHELFGIHTEVLTRPDGRGLFIVPVD